MSNSPDTKSKPRAVGQIDLSAFGYVERRRASRAGTPEAVGYENLDGVPTLSDPRRAERARRDSSRNRSLRVDHLGLVDDQPPPDLKIIGVNQKGLRVGYNPYDSGRLEKKEWKKPRDLRALSKWIESQRQAAQVGRNDEDDR
jgi:hypothetical protein